MPLYKFKYKTS